MYAKSETEDPFMTRVDIFCIPKSILQCYQISVYFQLEKKIEFFIHPSEVLSNS